MNAGPLSIYEINRQASRFDLYRRRSSGVIPLCFGMLVGGLYVYYVPDWKIPKVYLDSYPELAYSLLGLECLMALSVVVPIVLGIYLGLSRKHWIFDQATGLWSVNDEVQGALFDICELTAIHEEAYGGYVLSEIRALLKNRQEIVLIKRLISAEADFLAKELATFLQIPFRSCDLS